VPELPSLNEIAIGTKASLVMEAQEDNTRPHIVAITYLFITEAPFL
jgi:hypothetical protein